MTRFVFYLRLCILLCSILICSPPALAQQQDIEDKQVKLWAYKAVSRLLTYRYDRIEDTLTRNKYLLSRRGCKRFRWYQEVYGFSEDVEDRRETLTTTEFWTNKAYRSELDLITLKRLPDRERHIQKKEDLDHKVWNVEIPILLDFQKGTMQTKYKFVIDIDVRMINDNPPELVIEDWHYASQWGLYRVQHDNVTYRNHDYPECDDAPFNDIRD